MRLAFIQRLRARTQRLHHRLGGRHWFPHVPLALLLGLGGLWILNARFGGDWSQYAHALMRGDVRLNLRLLPSLLIGGGMVTMALGLLWRSRLAWVMAVLLGATGAVNTLLTGQSHLHGLLGMYDWTLSPDATKIAIVERSTDNIYLLNLKAQSLQRIIVKHWSNLASMDWTADGKGLFMFSNQRGGVLLHVDLHGNAQVLWEPHQTHVWAVTSANGRHVAMPLDLQHVNVWMMENF